jgi:hypothetical protein
MPLIELEHCPDITESDIVVRRVQGLGPTFSTNS